MSLLDKCTTLGRFAIIIMNCVVTHRYMYLAIMKERLDFQFDKRVFIFFLRPQIYNYQSGWVVIELLKMIKIMLWNPPSLSKKSSIFCNVFHPLRRFQCGNCIKSVSAISQPFNAEALQYIILNFQNTVLKLKFWMMYLFTSEHSIGEQSALT